MSTRLLSALVVSAALIAPGVALADGNGAQVCSSLAGRFGIDNPGDFQKLAHEGIRIFGFTLGGVPGQVQDDPGDAQYVAQLENFVRGLACPTPATPD